jgi:hypothetical protein
MQEGYSSHSSTFLTLEPLIYDIDESAYLFEECVFILSFADHCAAECSFVCVFELLKQLQGCLLCGPAKGNWKKKSQNMLIWLNNLVLAQHFSTGC